MGKDIYQRKEYDPIDVAYFAGIIDGEGSLYIGNFSCNPKTGTPYYQTNIQVSNTEKDLIEWLCATFGGLFSKRTPKQTPKNSRKDVFMWTASGERLTHLCELILPITKIKRRQVEILLEMRDTFKKGQHHKGKQGVQPLEQDVLNKRHSLMMELRSLHNRVWSPKMH